MPAVFGSSASGVALLSPFDRWKPDFLARIIARRPSTDNLETAEAIWGKPSNFVYEIDPGGYLAHLPTSVTLWPVDSGQDPSSDKPEPVYDYTEIARDTKKRRVTNPEDDQQYVDVEDATSILFQGQDGKLIRLNFADQGD